MNRHCLFVLINFSVKFPATKKKTDYDSKLKQKKISQQKKNTEIEIGPKKVLESFSKKKFPNIMNMMMMINNNNEEKKEKDYLNY